MGWVCGPIHLTWKIGVLLVLAGCNLAETTLPPTLSADSPATAITKHAVEIDPAQEWVVLAQGLEQHSFIPEDDRLSEIVALRIDPEHYTFRVHYRPGDPQTLSQWIVELSGAAAFVNGNFFDRDHHIVGLLVSDGIAYGGAYQGFGGLFAVQNDIPRVRSNSTEPYIGEPLNQAVQGFPMLILNGVQAYSDRDSERVARRTIIGQDMQGRVILMATPLVGMELTQLSNYLVATDLELVTAFNLDGGGSTMMYIAPGQDGAYVLNSFDPVPAVLAVYPR
jgi:hypothetical protein